jgi:hypothetical protein
MEEMIQQLVMKTGISKEQAVQVVEFLKQNAHKLPEWLGDTDWGKQLASKLPAGLGGLFKG